ncbi:hypothetical protein EZS27_029400 [termite gut metagenome]|uniref:Uncharacterized protein n=1 Tax=termite gut metagenome TaxID=433724 RepID=A0A5J4QG11_9ZZZZ
MLYGTGEMSVKQQSVNQSKNGSEPSLFTETFFPNKNQNKKESASGFSKYPVTPAPTCIHRLTIGYKSYTGSS